MIKEDPQLIIVAGVEAAGKRTFAKCYKNAFLQSLKLKNLKDGIKEGESFAILSTLSDPDLKLIEKAYRKDFRITMYFLFTGRLLSCVRGRYRQIAEGIPFDEAQARKDYDGCFKGLEEIYRRCDLVFFIRNQKEFEFLSAYEPKKVSEEDFHKTVRLVKKAVDTLKE